MSRPIATITGASRGLGRALALELARVGHDVIGLGRDREALARTGELCRAEGTDFTPVVVDLFDEAASVAAYRELPPADLAIANAGLVGGGPVLEQDRAEFLRLLTVNTIAAFEFLRESAAAMLAAKAPGRLLVIASDAAYVPIPQMAQYVTSKHAVSGMAKVMEAELARTGIRITVAYPGGIDTEMINLPEGYKHLAMQADDVARTLVHALLNSGPTVRVREIHLAALGELDPPEA